jgi:hypothetical protein
MDWLKALESISIIAASLTAILGVSSWRKAERWKRKYELAEEVLSKFYESQQIIKNIRSPFGFSDEGKTRNRSENETKEKQEIDQRMKQRKRAIYSIKRMLFMKDLRRIKKSLRNYNH